MRKPLFFIVITFLLLILVILQAIELFICRWFFRMFTCFSVNVTIKISHGKSKQVKTQPYLSKEKHSSSFREKKSIEHTHSQTNLAFFFIYFLNLKRKWITYIFFLLHQPRDHLHAIFFKILIVLVFLLCEIKNHISKKPIKNTK